LVILALYCLEYLSLAYQFDIMINRVYVTSEEGALDIEWQPQSIKTCSYFVTISILDSQQAQNNFQQIDCCELKN